MKLSVKGSRVTQSKLFSVLPRIQSTNDVWLLMSAQFKAPQQTLNSDSTNTLSSTVNVNSKLSHKYYLMVKLCLIFSKKKITLGEYFSGL